MTTTTETVLSNRTVDLMANFIQAVKTANRASSEEIRMYAENCAYTWETMLLNAGLTMHQIETLRKAAI